MSSAATDILRRYFEQCHRRAYPAGSIIISAGDHSSTLYYVLSGSVSVIFEDPDGHQLEICWAMDQIAPGEAPRPPEQWRTAASLEEAVADPPPGQSTEK